MQASGTLALPGARAGGAESAAYKGSVDAERPDARRLDRSHGRRAGRTSPPISSANVLDLDKIGGSGARPQAGARRRVASRPRAKPIDTGPLRSIDGTREAGGRRR